MVANAESICERLNAAISAHSNTNSQPREIAHIALGLAQIEQGGVNELAKLSAPAAIAGDWQQLLAYRRTLAGDLTKLGRDEQHDDLPKVHVVGPAMRSLEAKIQTLAEGAGFKACAQVG